MKTRILLSILLLAASIAKSQNNDVPAVLLQGTYPHGLPRKVAEQVSTNALPGLAAALRNPAYEQSRNNIVATLGFRGDENSVAALVSFLRDSEGEQSGDGVAGLLAVPKALGNLASRGHLNAVYELARLADPRLSSTNSFKWTRNGKVGDEAYREDLRRFAVEALGQSKHPEAITILERLERRPDVSARQKFYIAQVLRPARQDVPVIEPDENPIPRRAVTNSVPNPNVLQAAAIAEFKSIATLILNENLNAAVPRLIANGAALTPGNPANASAQNPNAAGRSMAEWQQSLQPTKAILRELDMNGVSFTPLRILARTNEMTVVRMVLPNTSNARQHLPAQLSSLSLGPANDLAVVMVLNNGNWSWLPFGW